MNIAAYCRVSTAKEEQLDSLTHQKEFFTRYAHQNGHTLIGLYADEGISGTSLKRREEFCRLMRDARQGLFQAVVVKDISRLARNTVDFLTSIRQLKAMGINTVFLTANMDSMGDSEFVLTLFSAMAQEESGSLSKRVKFGKKINAEKGRVPQHLFGYDRLDNFTLAVNAEEARIVRRIFSLYTDQGLGCRSISQTLNREGDKTKFGNDWNSRGVRRVLVNPIYQGILINHKYEVEDFLTGHQVPIPKNQQFCHQRPQWAIVSPETFQRAQQILRSRQQTYSCTEPFRQGRYSGKHIFSTLIKCPHCGRSFVRKSYTYTKTRVYWRCGTNDRYTAEKCDNRICLDEAELLEQLRSYFASLIGNSADFASEIMEQTNSRSSFRSSPDRIQAKTAATRKKLLTKQARYQELYANDLMELDDLKQKLSAISRELQSLEQTDTAARQSPEEAPCYEEQIRRFLSLETVTNSDLRRILDRITADRDGNVQIILKDLKPQDPPHRVCSE